MLCGVISRRRLGWIAIKANLMFFNFLEFLQLLEDSNFWYIMFFRQKSSWIASRQYILLTENLFSIAKLLLLEWETLYCIVIQQNRDDRAHTTRTISEHNRVTFVNWITTSALSLWYENRVSTESQICSASSTGPKIKYKHKFESTNRLIFPITPAALLFIELRIHQIQMLEFARELKSDLKDIFFVWWANTDQAEQREWIIIVNNKARFSLWTCTIKCSVDVVRLHCWLTEKYIPRPEDDYQTSCLSKQNIIQRRANSFESDERGLIHVKWRCVASRIL